MSPPLADTAAPMAAMPSRHAAFAFWLKLGFISFGGPAGQIAVMHEELVERRRWISEQRFLHALNYCMLLPGPEAQQLATYIGWLMHRTAGGLVAGGLFVLPSLFILVALSWVYMAFGQLPAIAGLFHGIKPAVTALVLHAAWRVGSRTLVNGWLWGIAVASFVAIFVLHLPFPLIVLMAGVAGAVGGRIAPHKFRRAAARAGAPAAHAPALVDDHTPVPAHARFAWPRTLRIVAAFAALWGGAIGALAAACGWNGTLTQMAWFFTKTAWLGFGGAYAILPYVVQGGVDHFHWLTAAQMMDGLALGETTPGPLIMVVAFVGFVGGWTQAVFGPGALALAGAAAATVVTFFTFLPSFFFILVGGPLIESTHGNLKFTAPLTGVTAAVVGVIVNLAAFFALHVLWPQGPGGRLDWAALAIGVPAAVALFRFKRGVIPVIAGAALAGLLLALAGVAAP
ncbi:MAG: chromate efflux transporter [Vitreoscilla sp.]